MSLRSLDVRTLTGVLTLAAAGLMTVVLAGCSNTVPDSNFQSKFEMQMKAQQQTWRAAAGQETLPEAAPDLQRVEELGK